MVRSLPDPVRPLRGGLTWAWRPSDPWLRVYHRDDRTPHADARRAFGPQHRMDHHTPPASAPAVCPAGRSIIYLARTLRTCGVEIFGDAQEAVLCSHWSVAALEPPRPIVVQDLRDNGAMLIGALPALGSGAEPRVATQAWARAIYEDRPGSPEILGVRYSGAHDEGPCLALWEGTLPLTVVEEHPLRFAPIFQRFLIAMSEVGVAVTVAPNTECARCREAISRGHPC